MSHKSEQYLTNPKARPFYQSWGSKCTHPSLAAVLLPSCKLPYDSICAFTHSSGLPKSLWGEALQHATHLNCTLLECIHAFSHSSGLPKSLWGKALQHATWLKNWTATHALDGKTPFKVLYGQLPDLSMLQSWGTIVLVHNAARSKLDVHPCKVCWLGLDVNARAHRVFWPGAGNVTVKCNVYFRVTALLEGEQNNLSIAGSEQAATPHITPISTALPLSAVCKVPSAIAPLPACISQPKQPSEEPTQL